MNNKPLKISICIPSYKEPGLMKKCLESIEKQTYTDYEVIITDDTPDDSVKDVVENFKNKINNLQYYKNPNTKGSPENWNECIKKAQGEYIKIIHHDDSFSTPDSLYDFAKTAEENPKTEFFFSSANLFNIKNNKSSIYTPDKNKIENFRVNPLLLITGNIIGPPSVILFKKTSEEFDINLKWLVDLDFYIRLIQKKSNFIFIEKPLINVSIGSKEQMTEKCKNKDTEFKEWFYVYKKYRNNDVFTIKESFHLFKLIFRYKIRSIKELKNITDIPNENTLIKIIKISNLLQCHF